MDYLLAELLLRSYDTNRLGQLKRASELLENFLKRLDDYDLLSASNRRLYERYRENRRKFSIIVTANPEERRNQKISHFQQEKSLKGKLKVSRLAAARCGLADKRQLLREQSTSPQVDDETTRHLYLAELSLFVHQTFQSFDAISQELSILSQMQQAPPLPTNGAQDDRHSSQASRPNDGGYSERLDGPVTMGGLGRRGGPLLSPSGKPLQPFTLTDKRTQLQNGVFRPGHNLPTMSIDEYLEEERKRGGIIEGGGNADQAQAEPDEDNMDLVDAATMKAREWDEFVEANPKGAGNTLNRG